MPEPWQLGAREAAQQIAAGTLTAEQLMRSCLERIAEREPAIAAWQFLDPERALSRARDADRQAGRGPLRGIPVGVKDVIDTADMPTTYGSGAYADYHPRTEASCVALARAAGAVMLGKTVTTEFAAVSPGKTRNPHNPAHTPGGSSSGSAAAVAAGMVPLAYGTQTSGSTIRPASFCGVVGFKPTYGMIDRSGVKTLAGGLDTVGLFARSVGDVAFFASVLAARPSLIIDVQTATPRIGLFRTAQWDRAGPATISAIEHAVAALERSGAHVVELPVPAPFADILDHHEKVMGWEMTQALAFEHRFRADKITTKTCEFLDANLAVTAEQYDEARQKTRVLHRHFDDLFAECDVLLTPAAVDEAPEGLDSTGDPTFNRGWTLLQVPCITVPAIKGSKGLPVGVQLVGQLRDDARTLATAAAIERALAAYAG